MITKILSKLHDFGGKSQFAPIIILGNQKSGTSAIAHLLADFGRLKKTVDIPPLWESRGANIILGLETFEAVVQKNKKYFTSDLIKEPMMTFFADQVIAVFPEARYVFIVRNPMDNIRSILNRRRLPGHLETLTTSHLRVLSSESILLNTKVWGGEGENYIGILAHRWNKAVDTYFRHQDRMILVRYKEFIQNKSKFISQLASQLNLSQRGEIESKVDIQFQPKGNQTITWPEFFGPKNLARIQRICGTRMKELGYPIYEDIQTG